MTIKHLLQTRLKPTILEITDDSHKHAGHTGVKQSPGGHYKVVIVAEVFKGKTVMQMHRMVYNALASNWKGNIHALTIKAKAPTETRP